MEVRRNRTIPVPLCPAASDDDVSSVTEGCFVSPFSNNPRQALACVYAAPPPSSPSFFIATTRALCVGGRRVSTTGDEAAPCAAFLPSSLLTCVFCSFSPSLSSSLTCHRAGCYYCCCGSLRCVQLFRRSSHSTHHLRQEKRTPRLLLRRRRRVVCTTKRGSSPAVFCRALRSTQAIGRCHNSGFARLRLFSFVKQSDQQ
jgi:hypothetical protein